MAQVHGPGDGLFVALGGLGVRFLADAARTGGGFALLEHPIAPRTLANPMHTHTREDEYAYVLHGRVGFKIDGEVIEAGPGDLVFKPRGVPHAFWNATDEPARVLLIISPAGFEAYFEEADGLWGPEGPDLRANGELAARYGVEIDFASGLVLAEQHRLALGPQGDRPD